MIFNINRTYSYDIEYQKDTTFGNFKEIQRNRIETELDGISVPSETRADLVEDSYRGLMWYSVPKPKTLTLDLFWRGKKKGKREKEEGKMMRSRRRNKRCSFFIYAQY